MPCISRETIKKVEFWLGSPSCSPSQIGGGADGLPTSALELRFRRLPPMASHAVTVASTTLRQRDPPSFSGRESDDVEDWLDGFQRVAPHNQYDDETSLNDAVFLLSRLAKTWFINHEHEPANWTTFYTCSRWPFERSVSSAAQAKRKLCILPQELGEDYTEYIFRMFSRLAGAWMPRCRI